MSVNLNLITQYGLSPFWVISVLLIFVPVIVAVQNYLRLRHVPGPVWAQLTEFWITRKLWKGENWIDITEKLHQDYGEVVRWAPRNVLFSDPAVISTIYATNNVWRKAKSYEPALTIINGKLADSFVTTRDERRVSAIKRQINSAFTAKAISEYESHVDETIQLLTRRVSEHSPRVNLSRWLELFAFETICQIAFSDSNFTEEDVQGTIAGIKERFNHWFWWFALPGLEKLLYRHPFVAGRMTPGLLTQRAAARVQERDAIGGVGSHQDLLECYMRANNKVPDTFDRGTVVGMVLSTIHAGAETTASTMIDTVYCLLKNPTCLATLMKELKDADLPSPPTFQSVAKLPYLEAAFKESMRLNGVSVSPLEREVPPGGAHVGGVYLPGGTSVALNVRGLALKEDVWGPEPRQFRPERWLEADVAARAKMERAFSGFGHGKRMCIGQHIAWIEMKKAIPELLLNFDIKLLNPDAPLEHYSTIVQVPKELWVNVAKRERKL